jgi:hypothetical protein
MCLTWMSAVIATKVVVDAYLGAYDGVSVAMSPRSPS